MPDALPDAASDAASNSWQKLEEWPELILERLEGAGVARIILNRPDKRNCWNRPLCLAFLDALDIIRADRELKVVVTRGAGPVYSSGLDLNFLREVSNGPMLDWDRPNLTVQIAEDVRAFPRIMIAQVHGYCLGGALGIMNCHDLVFAAEDAQLGMPEVLRGSFGQLVTATLMHSGLPVKKLSLIALGGKNVSGKEADALGIISQAVPAWLMMLDQLVGQRLRRVMDPLGDVEGYLKSQKGGANLNYKRPDVQESGIRDQGSGIKGQEAANSNR